jgi:hypothetical protein
MPLFTAEEWKKHVAERQAARELSAKKKRLLARQRRLRLKLKNNTTRFRRDDKLQTELRRVAALCLKLEVPLDGALEHEIIRDVMES